MLKCLKLLTYFIVVLCSSVSKAGDMNWSGQYKLVLVLCSNVSKEGDIERSGENNFVLVFEKTKNTFCTTNTATIVSEDFNGTMGAKTNDDCTKQKKLHNEKGNY